MRSRAPTVGLVLSILVDFLDPQVLVLGGGLVDALPKLIHEDVDAAIKKYSTPRAQAGLRVVVSKLLAHVISTGAAKLGFVSVGGRAHVGCAGSAHHLAALHITHLGTPNSGWPPWGLSPDSS